MNKNMFLQHCFLENVEGVLFKNFLNILLIKMMYLSRSNFRKFLTGSMCRIQLVHQKINQPTKNKVAETGNRQLTIYRQFFMQILEMQLKFLLWGVKGDAWRCLRKYNYIFLPYTIFFGQVQLRNTCNDFKF